MTPWFVVTGCARSGTLYAAEVLRALGIPCGHESVYGPRAQPRPRPPSLQGDASWLAAPSVKTLESDAVVLHQVRDPVAVVRSHVAFRFFDLDPDAPGLGGYVRFVRRWCPAVYEPDEEERRCLRYWTGWNRLVEDGARRAGVVYHRYRVEDLGATLLRELAGVLGHRVGERAARRALEAVPRTTNRWSAVDRSLTWETLPDVPEREAARLLAVEYGYENAGSRRTVRASASNTR